MNKLQQLIFNEGERLIPYVTHGQGELVRHRSSYSFFRSVIGCDLELMPPKIARVSIADLGFGSGYGCSLLSSIPSSQVTGVDIEPACEVFARQYYSRPNVDYVIADLAAFVPAMPSFDYVISRGVLEHVPNGIALIKEIRYERRVMIDVPYDEQVGNEHHLITGIREESFSGLEECELFYEDIEGYIYDASCVPERPNMIMVILSAPELPKVANLFQFPIPPVESNEIEIISQRGVSGNCRQFDSPSELLTAIEAIIKETEVVIDIGCGIRPMHYFRPKIHFLVEPCPEYADILCRYYADNKGVLILRADALTALRQFSDNSVDSIFMLDVIEHMEKDDGLKVIIELERIAREQIVIFTPLGFMPQHSEPGDCDAWGLSGSSFQEHHSGWEPSDFPSTWSFYSCKEFHTTDHRGKSLDQPFGAFFAVRNFEHKASTKSLTTDVVVDTPAEIALKALSIEHQQLKAYCDYLEQSNEAILKEYHQAVGRSAK